MRMLNQSKVNKRFKRSHILLIGSLFIFLGFVSLFWDYFVRMKDEVYTDMKISMMDVPVDNAEVVHDTPEVEESSNQNEENNNNNTNYTIDYSKYFGVLEIPKIGLKRGFYNVNSKYNNIKYNVSMVEGSVMPDIPNGNLILMAHSGDSYISYFAYLYRLEVGDVAYITYGGVKYQFSIVNIYEVPKTGVVRIVRNQERTTLTMITCTKDNDFAQTVYISELVG